MIVISKEQIIDLHKQLIEETGGSHGLRDEGLLDSAYNAPFQKFDNQELFPTIQQKSARLAFGLINNHPFVDGNKRIGAHITGSACAEWHRTQLQARRIVHNHPRYRIRGCRTKRFNRVDIKSPTLMKTKTEFLVICFLTGFSVCFLFCGVCSYLSDSG